MNLPDGRVLGFAEYGSQTGFPLIYCHGFPMCRLEAVALYKIALRRNLRVVAPDRPGFGLSSIQPHRRITDWPADVQALADHLDLPRFAVLGVSGGGPYALACAQQLQQSRMTAVGIYAGAPPWEAGAKQMPWFARLTSYLAFNWPTQFRIFFDQLVGLLRWIVNTRAVTGLIDSAILKATKEGDKPAPIEERRQRVIRAFLEPFAQGSEGAVEEARLLSSKWGIEYENVSYDEIQLWHGSKDVNAPVGLIRYMVKRLPHATLREYENDTHYTVFQHKEEVIEGLLPEEKIAGLR